MDRDEEVRRIAAHAIKMEGRRYVSVDSYVAQDVSGLADAEFVRKHRHEIQYVASGLFGAAMNLARKITEL
jgi:hypothetical protein